jgi:BirA family biotin operon repressor/biotin-[acetyl-CoA-carboxylase] ligase
MFRVFDISMFREFESCHCFDFIRKDTNKKRNKYEELRNNSYLCNVDWEIVHITETDSTNLWVKSHRKDDSFCVVADYQTAGRGCGTNTWESERGKNLLFSLLLHPRQIPASNQFHISMAVSLGIIEALGQHVLRSEGRSVACNGDLSIKWPNDIYWCNRKIGGILIENTLKGNVIKDSIIGVGLNVNQREFHSDAPNPVSMWQICEQETDREQLLQNILKCLDNYLYHDIKAQYCAMLYRCRGFHPFADKYGAFRAEIIDVEDDGHLLLRDDNGKKRCYAFKEVQFVI